VTSDDILDVLTDGGAGTKGIDLFVGPYPPSPIDLAGVIETGGVGPDRTMGNGPGGAIAENGRVQVMVRGTTYQGARNRAQKVCSVLDGVADRTVNDAFYHFITAVHPPAYVGTDANGHHLFATNFDLIRAWSATS